jgi:hypothetical protein
MTGIAMPEIRSNESVLIENFVLNKFERINIRLGADGLCHTGDHRFPISGFYLRGRRFSTSVKSQYSVRLNHGSAVGQIQAPVRGLIKQISD